MERPIPKEIKLVVFDLDDTLWTPELYMMNGPFRKDKLTKKVFDQYNTEIRIHSGAKKVLRELYLKHPHIKIGVASRTDYPDWAEECLDLLEIDNGVKLNQIVHYKEIYPGDKKTHFRALQKKSKLEFKEMVFFDNENRNIVSVGQLGVVSIYTPRGMRYENWEEALTKY